MDGLPPPTRLLIDVEPPKRAACVEYPLVVGRDDFGAYEDVSWWNRISWDDAAACKSSCNNDIKNPEKNKSGSIPRDGNGFPPDTVTSQCLPIICLNTIVSQRRGWRARLRDEMRLDVGGTWVNCFIFHIDTTYLHYLSKYGALSSRYELSTEVWREFFIESSGKGRRLIYGMGWPVMMWLRTHHK